MAIEKRLESEIARALKIMGHVRDRPEGLNEADTKAAFIDPILSALGWELRDPFSASQQYRHKSQDNPVDYALFILRAPVLFVEAKALNRDLSDYKWISQTLAYANAAGVEWCVLTNGDGTGSTTRSRRQRPRKRYSAASSSLIGMNAHSASRPSFSCPSSRWRRSKSTSSGRHTLSTDRFEKPYQRSSGSLTQRSSGWSSRGPKTSSMARCASRCDGRI